MPQERGRPAGPDRQFREGHSLPEMGPGIHGPGINHRDCVGLAQEIAPFDRLKVICHGELVEPWITRSSRRMTAKG